MNLEHIGFLFIYLAILLSSSLITRENENGQNILVISFFLALNYNSYEEIEKSPLLQLHISNKILNSDSFQEFCPNKYQKIQNKFIYTSLKKEQKSYIDNTCNSIPQKNKIDYKKIILTIKELKDDENKMILLKDYLESIK